MDRNDSNGTYQNQHGSRSNSEDGRGLIDS